MKGGTTLAIGTKLYSYVEVRDDTPLQKLTLGEQLRLLLRKLTEDPANELKSEDAVKIEYLQRKANLIDFIKKAAKPLVLGEHKIVLAQISNEFRPVLNEVLTSPEIANYYIIDVATPETEYDIQYEDLIRIQLKGS